jgi:DNA-binding beta-propeller fold protein YncE
MEAKLVKVLHIGRFECNTGLAVNAEETVLAISNSRYHDITVYSLPEGTLQNRFQVGTGSPRHICFTSTGCGTHLLIATHNNRCLQEMTIEGAHVRSIGRSVFDAPPDAVDCNASVIVACQPGSRTQQVLVFSFNTGELLQGFGSQGRPRGCLSSPCGLKLSYDGRHIFITEKDTNRVSIFTVNGSFVNLLENSSALSRPCDVCFSSCGEIVVACSWSHTVVVFAPDGSCVRRVFGARGLEDGNFVNTRALQSSKGKVYVLDGYSDRVQVFV